MDWLVWFGLVWFGWLAGAGVAIFQSITLEGWTDIMFQCQDAVSPVSGTVFFVVLTLFGGFFALNLVLAVLEEAFHKVM